MIPLDSLQLWRTITSVNGHTYTMEIISANHKATLTFGPDLLSFAQAISDAVKYFGQVHKLITVDDFGKVSSTTKGNS